RPSELLALRRQDINFDRGVINVGRNLIRFGEGLPKTSYSEHEVNMLAPVRAALAEQQARVELKSTFVFCDCAGDHLSLKELRGAWFRLLRYARLRERPSTSVGTLLPHCFFPRDETHCTWPIRWVIRRSQWSLVTTPAGRRQRSLDALRVVAIGRMS